MNPPKLTILTADTDAACDPGTGTCTIAQAACDPGTGTCTIAQAPIPSPGAAPATAAVLPGTEETPSP